MQSPMKSEEQKTEQTVEERLAKVGARIDDFIVKAAKARDEAKLKLDELKHKEETALKKGEEALDEFKSALDSALLELNQAWKEVKDGAERAAHKLHSK